MINGICDVCKHPIMSDRFHSGACERIRQLEARVRALEEQINSLFRDRLGLPQAEW